MSCGVDCRHDSDLVLLWLWLWQAAVALIRPLAWEAPYASGVALKSKKKKEAALVRTQSFYQNILPGLTSHAHLGNDW